MRASALSAAILALAALAFSGSAAEAQDRYYDRQDLRGNYGDIQHDYAQADRLRADIARDYYQRDQARSYSDRYAARQYSHDIKRDKHALRALKHDIRHDRHDIHRDQRDLYRDGYSR
jgi:hypothetical protein